ncbi:MAG: hypothetical protein ABL921_09260 [Pirellula sp.]
MLVLYRLVSLPIFLSWLSILANPIWGQDASPMRGTSIAIAGVHEVVLVPDKLRLMLLIKIESRDGKRALQSLTEHQQRVTKELEAMGAVAGSIEMTKPIISVGVPGVDDPEAARKRAKQQAAQLRNINIRGRAQADEVDDESELPLVYTASTRLVAEWRLSKEDEESNLLLPIKIRAAIDQNDFKGRKHRVVLNEDEQKLIAPLLGVNIYTSERTIPEVLLFFVGKITETQEEEATKEAFKKAQQQAGTLSRAVGKKVTGIRSATISPLQSSSVNRTLDYGSNSQLIQSLLRKDLRESIHEDANLLKQQISVSIQFETE